jgi:type II secretory pathway component PulF
LSLAYPILSLVLAFSIYAFICASLVTTFESIFKDFGVPLPKITILLIEVAHLFQQGWMLVPQLIGLCLFLWIGSHLVLRASLRKSLMGGVPVIGGVWRTTSLAEFCHLLALLLESEVPLDEALRMTGEGVLDASIDHACGAMAADVSGGLTLSQAISRRPIFPRGLAQVLRWAEKHHGLADSLHMAGELFEARAQAQASFAGTVLSVLALIAILLGAALVVMGLFLPLISLISRLAG